MLFQTGGVDIARGAFAPWLGADERETLAFQPAPGVRTVPTPGHAPGHQSLVVDFAETGRVVLCGDAAFTRENLERDIVPQPDLAAGAASLARIREIVDSDLDRAFTSHDQRSWERWRHAPEVYR